MLLVAEAARADECIINVVFLHGESIMFNRITAPLLFAGLAFASSAAHASDQCDNFDLDKASDIVQYHRHNGFLPLVDVVGDGPVQMYSAPMKGCEIPGQYVPKSIHGVAAADITYNGWAYVLFPVPGDNRAIGGFWVEAKRVAFSKDQY